MKNSVILFFSALLLATVCVLAFVPNKPQRMDNPLHKTTASPIEGAWELYSTEKAGKTTYHKKPSQIKVHHDGYCSVIAFDSTGKFNYAAAATYELDGIHYKETCTYHTMPALIGASLWFDCSITGDTMLLSGFKKVVMADGRDVTKDWGGDSFVQKKVRVKK